MNSITDPAASDPAGSSARSLFFSQEGFRAGWGLLLYLLLALLLLGGETTLLGHLHLLPAAAGCVAPAQQMGPGRMGLQDGSGFLAFAAAAWLLSRLERRPFRRYGTPWRHALLDFATGSFWGFTLLSALVSLLLVTGHLAWDGPALHGTAAAVFALRWAATFLLVALFEEFLFRGYLQYTLARGISSIVRTLAPQSRHSYAIGFWTAAVLLSCVLFSASHVGNGGETLQGLLAVSLAGLVFAFSLWRTASLWWAIGFHAAWDWAQTFFYGTPDSGIHGAGHLFNTHPLGNPSLSGGSDGPEGSLLVIPVLLLALAIASLTLRYRPRTLTADQQPQEP